MKYAVVKWLLLIAGLGLFRPAASGQNEPGKPVRQTVHAVDGVDIVCDVRGQGEPTLIFLHGWCGDRSYWKNQADAFSTDHRVVTLDQAGHGESGKNRKSWTVSSLAGDVESVVKALDLKRVIVIGHSMGGQVGLAAAKRMPGKVIAVIGVDTLQNAEFKMPEETTKQFLDSFTADFRGTIQSMFAGLLPETADPGLVKWLSAKAAAQDPNMATALMRDLVNQDTKKSFQEAHVPIRCINSSGGYQFFTPTATDVNRKYADYKAVLIDNVGHYPMLEKPAEFNRPLRQVLKEFTATE